MLDGPAQRPDKVQRLPLSGNQAVFLINKLRKAFSGTHYRRNALGQRLRRLSRNDPSSLGRVSERTTETQIGGWDFGLNKRLKRLPAANTVVKFTTPAQGFPDLLRSMTICADKIEIQRETQQFTSSFQDKRNTVKRKE